MSVTSPPLSISCTSRVIVAKSGLVLTLLACFIVSSNGQPTTAKAPVAKQRSIIAMLCTPTCA